MPQNSAKCEAGSKGGSGRCVAYMPAIPKQHFLRAKSKTNRGYKFPARPELCSLKKDSKRSWLFFLIFYPYGSVIFKPDQAKEPQGRISVRAQCREWGCFVLKCHESPLELGMMRSSLPTLEFQRRSSRKAHFRDPPNEQTQRRF